MNTYLQSIRRAKLWTTSLSILCCLALLGGAGLEVLSLGFALKAVGVLIAIQCLLLALLFYMGGGPNALWIGMLLVIAAAAFLKVFVFPNMFSHLWQAYSDAPWWLQILIRVALAVVVVYCISRCVLQAGQQRADQLISPRELTIAAGVYYVLKAVIVLIGWGLIFGGSPQVDTSRLESEYGRTPIEIGELRGEGIVVIRSVAEEARELMNIEHTFRYAFGATTPNAESLVFTAIMNANRKEAERLAENQQGNFTSANKPDSELREQVVRDLKSSQKKLFLNLAEAVDQNYALLRISLTAVTLFVAESYGIHLACYLLFYYCIRQLNMDKPGPHAPRDLIEEKLGSKEQAGVLQKIRYARELLPQLGFLGTLLGLSFAIMQISLTDSVQQILEKPGISPELTFSLGMAFNTTFVALLLSATLTLYFSYFAGTSAYARELIDRLEKA